MPSRGLSAAYKSDSRQFQIFGFRFAIGKSTIYRRAVLNCLFFLLVLVNRDEYEFARLVFPSTVSNEFSQRCVRVAYLSFLPGQYFAVTGSRAFFEQYSGTDCIGTKYSNTIVDFDPA